MQVRSLTHRLLVLVAFAGLGAFALVSSGGLAQAAPDTYTVKDGDTLYSIASSLGYGDQQAVFSSLVVSLNGLSGPDQLSVGQVLKLPTPGGSSGSSSSTASTRPATTTQSTVQTVSQTTTSGGGTYTVKDGDTLYAIADALGYTGQEATFSSLVVSLNGLSGPDQLSVGQVLKLPGSGGGSSSGGSSSTSQSTAATASNNSGGASQPAASTSTASIYNQAAFNATSNLSSADCQDTSKPTCDYGSNDKLVIPSISEGDSTRCGSSTVNASVNVYDVRTDGAMGVPVADCDVVRQNFSIFNGYGGYPGSGGTTVLAGHVDYHPHYQAVFWYVRDMKPGTEIDYINKDGKKIVYSVDWAQAITDPNYDWASLAKTSSQESLVLITCDGVFNPDTHEYDHRFVAHATRTS